MKPVEYYKDREQTYVKHFFIERYLETVAYHIGFWNTEFDTWTVSPDPGALRMRNSATLRFALP